MEKGYLSIVLHAHLPFVRHPEHDDFLEEDWLYEAITETYIPLLEVFEGCVRDKVGFRITMSLTPTLLSMLLDPLLQQRYLKHLDGLIELSHKEIERTRWQPEFNALALMYHHRFTRARQIFCDEYKMNLVTAFKKFYDAAKRHGFILYPGKLTQVETFRVGCIGAIGTVEMEQAVNAVSLALQDLGIAIGSVPTHKVGT